MISLKSGFERAAAIGQTSTAREMGQPARSGRRAPGGTSFPVRLSVLRTLALLLTLSVVLSASLISAQTAQEAPIPPPPATATPNANEPAPAIQPESVPESVEESVGVEADALVAVSSRVALAQFTTAIEEREPIDQVSFIGTDVDKIYFFTDLREMTGSVVTHRWVYDGTVMAEVDFAVKGPRWRVWSSKALKPEYIGDWTVEVVTSDGEVLASETLTLNATNG